MKRVFIFLILSASTNLCLHAQTYCYQHTITVEKETGIKNKGSEKFHYITFVNNKRSCYFSDENGNTIQQSSGRITGFGGTYTGQSYKGENYYVYKGEKDGLYVYEEEVVYMSYVYPNIYMGERGGDYPMYTKKSYLYFNTSYDRINVWEDPQQYLISSSNSDSQSVKAMRMGYSIGSSVAPSSGDRKTYIKVYERKSIPKTSSQSPTIFY